MNQFLSGALEIIVCSVMTLTIYHVLFLVIGVESKANFPVFLDNPGPGYALVLH